MYKVLIIEENPEIRNRIQGLIDWEHQGFQIIAAISNGIVGRAIMERQKPDIIMLSMSSIYLGGLGFIESIENIGFPFSIIQMYTKTNTLINCKDYIINTNLSLCRHNLNRQDLIRTLTAAAADISKYKEDVFQIAENQPMKVQRNNAILKILSGIDAEKYGKLEKRFFFGFQNVYLTVILIYPATGRSTFEKRLHHQLSNIVWSVLSQTDCGEVFFTKSECMGAVIRFSKSDNRHTRLLFFSLTASKICEAIKSQIGIDAVCILPDESHELGGLHKAFHDANEMEPYRYFMPDAGVITQSYIASHSISVSFDEIDICVRKLSDAIGMLRYEDLGGIFAQLYLSQIKSSMDTSVLQYARDCLQTLYTSFIDELSVEPDTDSLRSAAEQCPTVEQECFTVKSYFASLIQKASEKKENLHPVIRKATNFITRYYADDLTLDGVAAHVNVSAVHLSRLFRRELRVTFTEYLTSVRVEQAKRLMMLSDDRIADVAALIGYRDKKYFSRVFKKSTGVSPSVYRSGK